MNVSGQRMTDRLPSVGVGPPIVRPGLERGASERREPPLWRDTGRRLGDRREQRRLREEVRDSRHSGRDVRPAIDEPERVGAPRTEPPLVVMGEELRL